MLCTQERPLILEDPLLEGLTGCIESILECLAAWQCKAFQRHRKFEAEIHF